MAAKKAALFVRVSLAVMALLAFVVAFIAWCYWGAVFSVDTSQKVVALTYDDGPNPPHTQVLLNVLASNGVKATFFLKGQNIDAFPEIVPLIAAAGHEIGNHSYYHLPMRSFSRTRMRDEVQRVNEQLNSILGYTPHLFRPPFGVQGPGLKLALDDLHMTSVLANATGMDWELSDAQKIAETVLADVAPGSIVLLHDGHGDTDQPAGQDSRAATVQATELIISKLKSQGYRFVTVTELQSMARN